MLDLGVVLSIVTVLDLSHDFVFESHDSVFGSHDSTLYMARSCLFGKK